MESQGPGINWIDGEEEIMPIRLQVDEDDPPEYDEAAEDLEAEEELEDEDDDIEDEDDDDDSQDEETDIEDDEDYQIKQTIHNGPDE